MKIFDILNVDLNGKNLVEASAGRGKTYAIGILVLRMLLEKNIKIEQILMVTYTNAAVEELEFRIRKFISEAILHTRKIITTEDKQIHKVLEKSIKNIGAENTLKLLNEAVEFLDETSIFTIHGFCKRVLTEYAFENSMLLNTEIIDDQTYLIENAISEFWRKNITILEPEILTRILDKDFTLENIKEVYFKVANGYELKLKNKILIQNILPVYKVKNSNLEIETEKFKTGIEGSWEIIESAKIGKLRKLYKTVTDRNSNEFINEFLIKFETSPDSNDLQKINFLYPQCELVLKSQNDLSHFIDDVIASLINNAILFIDSKIEQKKKRNKLLSFYDLIKILYNSVVVKGNEELKRELNYKYKAIFIDEFQDTDILQYDIFRKLFIENSKSILFFIGDPKQSIYAFRGADLDTYNSAKENLKNSVYSMNTNFRSTKKLLNGINEFFQANSKINNLKYTTVEYGNDTLGELITDDFPDNAFEIINNVDPETSKSQNQDQIIDSMSNEIIKILKSGKLIKENISRSITPSDIGILVRNRSHAKIIKENLSKFSIPAIIVDDTKVTDTDEARELFYILTAILEPDDAHINRALLTIFTGFNTDQINNLDREVSREIFINLQNTWNSSGVYAAISGYIKYFNVKSQLVFSNNPQGNRIYTNMIQLAEILNEKEVFEGYTPIQLADWLLRARQGDKNVSKYEQLLENDEESIQIVTVHKSKGLSYNIVILPVFNLSIINKNNFSIEYKSAQGHKIVSTYNDDDEKEYSKIQEQQENERLLYVAITRAVYKCIIHYNHKDGIIRDFIENIDQNSNNIIFKAADNTKNLFAFKRDENLNINYKPILFNSEINNNWKVSSYSAISNQREYTPKLAEKVSIYSNNYDEFIFNTLEKGVRTGLIIHSIMEKINFSNSEFHEFTIKNVLNDYGLSVEEPDLNYYVEMVGNILNTTLTPKNFNLTQINFQNKITELEFYFSLDKFRTTQLNSLLPHLNLSYSELEGVMHGFIDLVFKFEEKFYILDWKTNHIGSRLKDYSFENIADEVKTDNYDLQYLIYTIGLIRYLKSKISDFDYKRDFGGVFYLFIRGVRKNNSTGIFYDMPDINLIKNLEDLL